MGAVQLHIGSPRTIDMAIMYLYGICPELNMKNIAILLDLAEFFLLPNLKMLCFTWLEKVALSEANVVDILHMCSIYGLNIPEVELFIEQRLLKLLNGDHLLTLSPESVAILFSDQRLSYVPIDLKIKFISQWIRQRQNTRMDQVAELMASIDIPRMLLEKRQQSNHQEHCLITYQPFTFDFKVLAYCFIDRQWYNLQIPAKFKITTVCNNLRIFAEFNSTIFCKGNSFVDGCHFITYDDAEKIVKVHDLERNITKQIAVEYFKPPFEIIYSKLVIKNGICYLMQTEHNNSQNSKSTLLMSPITHICEKVRLNPVLFFKGKVFKWCVNSSKLVAILIITDATNDTCSKNIKTNLLVYDQSSSSRFDVTHLLEDPSEMLEVYGIEQGFAVVDGCHISLIRLQHGSSALARLSMMHVQGEGRFSYAFIDNNCYRFSSTDRTLEWTNSSNLLEHYAITTQWGIVAIPKDIKFDLFSFKNIAHMSLKRTKLMCHFNCPHCELKDEEAEKEWGLEVKSLDFQTCKNSITDSDSDDYFLDKYCNNVL
ncbi:uncharacterized protein LOC127850630 isoform X2 [Dreissena polymorpha]|uniref:uncharacterized protein LOC127850630 isoform X2 n=1 Tax=Dreissena polymorpha TaxID=45954 RepID=UPI002264A18D|nr:uncharacterized protein LOC127850630 isoform X2 [Dreissena polymorpha]